MQSEHLQFLLKFVQNDESENNFSQLEEDITAEEAKYQIVTRATSNSQSFLKTTQVKKRQRDDDTSLEHEILLEKVKNQIQ